MAEGFVPDDYKSAFQTGLMVIDKAAELKKQKDELQIAGFNKLIEPLWVKYDTEEKGFISKEQCVDMVKAILAKGNYADYFN